MGFGRGPNSFHFLLYYCRGKGIKFAFSSFHAGELCDIASVNISNRILLFCTDLCPVTNLELVRQIILITFQFNPK